MLLGYVRAVRLGQSRTVQSDSGSPMHGSDWLSGIDAHHGRYRAGVSELTESASKPIQF